MSVISTGTRYALNESAVTGRDKRQGVHSPVIGRLRPRGMVIDYTLFLLFHAAEPRLRDIRAQVLAKRDLRSKRDVVSMFRTSCAYSLTRTFTQRIISVLGMHSAERLRLIFYIKNLCSSMIHNLAF